MVAVIWDNRLVLAIIDDRVWNNAQRLNHPIIIV